MPDADRAAIGSQLFRSPSPRRPSAYAANDLRCRVCCSSGPMTVSKYRLILSSSIWGRGIHHPCASVSQSDSVFGGASVDPDDKVRNKLHADTVVTLSSRGGAPHFESPAVVLIGSPCDQPPTFSLVKLK